MLVIVSILVLAVLIAVLIIVYQRRMYTRKQEISERELASQKQLTDALILDREKEQKRIAQELHDGIGSALTALKMATLRMKIQKKDKNWIDETVRMISSDVRKISNELMPSILENMGLRNTLETLIKRLNPSSEIQFSFGGNLPEHTTFGEERELALYRIVQELLNNIIKYAEATTVSVNCKLTDRLFQIQIEDNGRGFVPSSKEFDKPGSLGLKNIKSRIQQINGRIEYQPRKHKGTLVTIEIRLHEKD